MWAGGCMRACVCACALSQGRYSPVRRHTPGAHTAGRRTRGWFLNLNVSVKEKSKINEYYPREA